MATKPKPNHQEFWTLQYAADYLGYSVRRLREIREKIGQVETQTDPATRRPALMLHRADVEAFKRAQSPASTGVMLRPAPAAAPPPDPKPWVTIADAAEASGLPASVILRLIEAGRLGAIDCGPRPGGRWRVRRADLATVVGDSVEK